MWIRIIVMSNSGPWHIVLTNDDNYWHTMCGEYTRNWREHYVVEMRIQEPLVEETCGWCMAKMMELAP
jgi:hypothetical protein